VNKKKQKNFALLGAWARLLPNSTGLKNIVEKARCNLRVIASRRSRRGNPSSPAAARQDGLLRFARNDDGALKRRLNWHRFRKSFLLLFFKKEALAFFLLGFVAILTSNIWNRSTFTTPRPTTILTDRNGVFLAQLGGGAAGYGYWPVGAVPPRVAVAILALEDRRFWDHPGVDPLAVARAMRADVFSGRRVSGASTIAMQVARMQNPETRTLGHKILEAATALVMTARYGRGAVLRQYLTLVPFGENTHGIADAAAWYFNRPVADLSWGQIALLSAIPQAPGRYNPGTVRGLRLAKARAATALGRLRDQDVIDAPTYAEALADLAQLAPPTARSRPPDALHAVLHIASVAAESAPAEHMQSTIDIALQARATAIARRRLDEWRPYGAQQLAVIVADRRSMGVLALVGSQNYSATDDGEIDYAMRWRSPGSTLKPFIFAQALDRGVISPATLLPDSPDSGTEVENADRRFLGPLLPEQALGNSRNVPAASLVRRDGLEASHWFLASLGLDQSDVPGARYGLSLAIGSMPTELDRLVAAYGALANDGVWRPLRWYDGQPEPPARRLISVGAARTVTLFLSDPMARLPSFARMGSTEFPFPVAVKTGTSQGYRDAWVVEFTDKYVVGVWVGRPDGAPMDQLGGATSAALIGQDILLSLYYNETDGQDDGSFAAPPGTAPVDVCAQAGVAADGCARQLVAYLPGGAAPAAVPPAPAGNLRIVAPLNHSDFILNPDAPPGLAVLPLRVAAGSDAADVEWFVDGQAYQMAKPGDTVDWPAVPGRHVFVARDPSAGTRSKPVIVVVN
jgi:penicillin-binding protein 1C